MAKRRAELLQGDKRVTRICRWLTALGAAFAACSTALAQPAPTEPERPVLVAADLREHQSLDGAWHWSIDPYRDGVAGFHGDPAGPSSRRWADIVQADAARADPTALFEFDTQRSPVAHLPGSWIGHAPEMRL